MSGLNPIDVVEEDAADLMFPKGMKVTLNTAEVRIK